MQNDYVYLIREKLKDHAPVFTGISDAEISAVVIPLIRGERGLEILFEKRAGALSSQPGEVCLPGGRLDKGETAEEAGIREICEELLIDSRKVHVIGKMNAVMGPSGAPVWPMVALLEDYSFTYSDEEVAEVFTVPLEWFVNTKPEVYMTWLETKPEEGFPYELIPGGKKYPWRRKKNPVYFYRADPHVIWGMTAKVIADLISLLAAKTVCEKK
jgi:8-oxo-dGTP pyrophosphatase MutT (NUDIX family)